MKWQGFGRVDQHSPISKEDLEKIQPSYNPSPPDPKSLQQVVWFNIMFHLIRRGRENLRLLTKESFATQVDAAGKISKELKLSQKYTNHCIRATAVSLLDECNFEARHIMCVSGHKSDSRIRSYSRRLSEVKRKEISHALTSACSVKNLESTSTAIVAMHEQASETSLGQVICDVIARAWGKKF